MRYSHWVMLLGFALLVGCRPAPLPERFNDSVTFEYGDKRGDVLRDTPVFFNFQLPERARFEMTRVPGDPEQGIEPYYLSTTEVRAEMFFPWATGRGLVGKAWEQWRSLGLRPSWIAREVLDDGPPNRPALSMSRTVAEHYCQWLSEQTGRTYRLPTETEWEHALELGGGIPAEREDLLRRATLRENARGLDEVPFMEQPTPVASRSPDDLGLYDMLGNAAEWVVQTGDERVVRGGHFLLEADKLTERWRAIEDIEVWNATFPNLPRSEHWYHSFYMTGIRLACDADQAAQAAKPRDPDTP